MNAQMQLIVKTSPSLSLIPVQAGQLQRKKSEEHEVDEDCPRCSKGLLNLQRKSANLTEPSSVPPVVHEVLNSPGQPLDAGTRAFMEPRFGHDFSKVRVHTDGKAAESAKSVNSLAYTVGQNIGFGAGQYAPETTSGRRLLAHELAHVSQQAASFSADSSLNMENSPAAEQEADYTSEKVISGQMSVFHPVHASSGLQRSPAPVNNSIVSMPLEEAIKNLPQLPPDDALAVLKRYQNFIIVRISSGEGRIRQQMSLRAESFGNYIIGGTIEFFGRTSLPSENWEEPWQHVNAAYSTIGKRQVKESLNHLNSANKATTKYWAQLNEYLERTEKGADRSILVLEGLQVAGAAAATALSGGGATAIVVGAGYAGTQRLAGEATSTYIGLQDHIDWGGVIFDTLFAAVAGKFGGRLGTAIAARLGGKITAQVASSLIVGRASGITHAIARELFDGLRGQTELTVDGFIDRLAEQLTLRAVFLDFVAAGTSAAFQASSSRADTPPTNKGGSRPLRSLQGGAPGRVSIREGRVVSPSTSTPTAQSAPVFGSRMSAAPSYEPQPETIPAPRFRPYAVPDPVPGPSVQAAKAPSVPTPPSLVPMTTAIAASAGPASASNNKPPMQIRLVLPPEKAVHADLYSAMIAGRHLEHVPNKPRHTAQARNWDSQLEPGGEMSIYEEIWQEFDNLDVPEIRRLRPNWSRTLNRMDMEVDHRIEWQLLSAADERWGDTMANYELLDQPSNGSAGSSLRANIQAERNRLATIYGPQMHTQRIVFTQLVVPSSGSAATRWFPEEIQVGQHYYAYLKMLK